MFYKPVDYKTFYETSGSPIMWVQKDVTQINIYLPLLIQLVFS